MSINYPRSRDEFQTTLLLLLPSLAIAAGIFTARIEAFLPGILGITFFLVATLIYKEKPVIWRDGFAIGAGTILLVGISSLWAIEPSYAFERCLKISAIILPAILLASIALPYNRINLFPTYRCFLFPVIAAGGFLSIEFLTGMPVFQWLTSSTGGVPVFNLVEYNRALVILFLMAIPAIGLLWHQENNKRTKYIYSAVLLLTIIYIFFHARSQTAQLALLVGIGFLFFPVQFKFLWLFMAVGLAVGILGFPFLVEYLGMVFANVQPDTLLYEASIPHRLEVWSFVTNEIFKHPVIGQGIEAIRFLKTDVPMDYVGKTSILHPHSAILQFWVEFGVVGALFLTFTCLFTLRNIYLGRNKAVKSIQLAMFMAFCSVAATGYGFWQGWILGFMILYTITGLMVSQACQTIRK